MTTIPENSNDLLLSSYRYDLPQELIAERPVQGRHNSRLLVYRISNHSLEDRVFSDLPAILGPNDHLVLNNSKVIPCRIKGKRPTGGEIEVFVLGLRQKSSGNFQCLIKSNSKKKVGDSLLLPNLEVSINEINQDGTFWIQFGLSEDQMVDYLSVNATIPIPPYIRQGMADESDRSDYQTVYAKYTGSVAAPTAGLHFTPELFERLENRGIGRSEVTLHVGLGTFTPIKEENILNHQMHYEHFSADAKTLNDLNGHLGNLIAVGTTSLRVLESLWSETDQKLMARPDGENGTNIFIHPGKKIHSIKGLITNFHLPESSLLVLVSALIGREKTLEIYRYAVSKRYRFFSYGDAMLILR